MDKHANFRQNVVLMNGDFFMVFTQQNPLLIFLNEDFIKDLVEMSSSILQIRRKRWHFISSNQTLFSLFFELIFPS
jgi:hypothetical protein